MRIVVSAFGPSLDDLVHERFGRSYYLLLVDSSTMSFSILDTAELKDEPQGAGVGSAEKIAEIGAEALISGHIGDGALAVLEGAGIPVFDGSGHSVIEAVQACAKGQLPPLPKGAASGLAHKRMPRHDTES